MARARLFDEVVPSCADSACSQGAPPSLRRRVDGLRFFCLREHSLGRLFIATVVLSLLSLRRDTTRARERRLPKFRVGTKSARRRRESCRLSLALRTTPQRDNGSTVDNGDKAWWRRHAWWLPSRDWQRLRTHSRALSRRLRAIGHRLGPRADAAI
jgi:hypothetical protein